MNHPIENLFTSIAPRYDLINHVLSLNIDRRWRKKTMDRISAECPAMALDLCAGTLDLSIEFLSRFPNAKVTAADFSQAMLGRGLAKLNAGQLTRVTTLCADAHHLPCDADSFDLAFCGYGFRNLDDTTQALKELRRVIRPKGQLLILDFYRPAGLISRAFHKTYGHTILPMVGGLISGNRRAYRYLNDSVNKFYSTGECEAALGANGFNRIRTTHFFGGVSSLVEGYKV